MKNTVLITGASSGFGKAAAKLFDANEDFQIKNRKIARRVSAPQLNRD